MRTSKHKSATLVVIGGGISGLSAAHRLIELSSENALNTEVILLEGSGRLGGVISTKVKDEFILEEGPDSFITTKPRALDLCLRVGLEGDILETNDETRRIFVARRDKLVPIPEGFFLRPDTYKTFYLVSTVLDARQAQDVTRYCTSAPKVKRGRERKVFLHSPLRE